MNLKTALVLLVLSVITIFALVCVLLTGRGGGSSSQPSKCSSSTAKKNQFWPHPAQSQLFSDLTREELVSVMRFLTQRLGSGLVDARHARPSDNCVYSVELQLPPKSAALAHLDRKAPPPPREALAIVFFGQQAQPNVSELVVGPLPNPSYLRDVTVERHGGPLPYYRRPLSTKEFEELKRMIFERELPRIVGLLHRCCYYNGRNLLPVTTAPRGLRSGDRATWFGIYYNISGGGFYLHPVGLELLIDHEALDPAQWTVQQAFYHGRYYRNLDHLEQEFEGGRVEVVEIALNGSKASSSLRPRVPPGPPPPLQFSPQGPRYNVKGSQVASPFWTFTFSLELFSGMRIFDIRFQGERVAYEVSVQEALTIYGGNSPAAMITRYLDGSFGMGLFTTSLTRGVDCPYLATYVDWVFLADSGTPGIVHDALCIFEQNQGIPIRRHHSDFFSYYYGGLPGTVLIVRSVSTLLNYDYVWDMAFHPTGTIEVKFHATGYISSSFLFGAGRRYGNQVGEHALGTIHTHAANFKVDLDVAGQENWVVAEDMAFESRPVPWSPKHEVQQMQLIQKTLETEDQAAFAFGGTTPRYIYLASNHTNVWGHRRGYRIQIINFAGQPIPQESSIESAFSWGRYQLAVTQRKEEEPSSTSIYNQNDPWTPAVNFTDFINNETIAGKDLVTWVTVGFLHIPHAEDIPNTVTVGNGVGFFLRPYNFFNEDPSVQSPDGVYFQNDGDARVCEINPVSCLPETAACAPDLPDFTHGGFRTES
ncbi:membrane primary amine oxidase-like isoform X1 [Vombatus ursinus]|uniref:Amine oxidase n=1 Tax=Vombatus ursinus TaxID=29139 RepID=A0A4X2LS85_VOMUR|nr:membrane primary amine oxidase-like isoform X1 [Vombatus ursinus]